MKITPTTEQVHTFKPFTITIESWEEACALYRLFNLPYITEAAGLKPCHGHLLSKINESLGNAPLNFGKEKHNEIMDRIKLGRT